MEKYLSKTRPRLTLEEFRKNELMKIEKFV